MAMAENCSVGLSAMPLKKEIESSQFMSLVLQVSLAGRVSQGISVRKTLAKEAVLCAASVVVVGANNGFLLGGSASVAKYCAKKLPMTATLIAFHNGRVIFKKESAKPNSGQESKPNLRSILHPSVGMDTKAIVPSFREKPNVSSDRQLVVYDSSRISVLVKKLPESKPGWPLLRKALTANIEALKENEARKMSVVQWVMNLPDRSLLHSATNSLIKELEIVLHSNSSTCKWFQYEELQISTNYFSADYLIGKGGSSQVYKGCLPNGDKVAIKMSKLSKETSRDFLLEADIITKLQHERVVPLLGICIECQTFLSIYGYFSKGSLEENLHGNRTKPPLSWHKRFKIAVGVAEALSYLHNGSSRPVIHRDVKSSNILLNDNFEPQISDFGFAIWAPMNSLSQAHTDVVGTFGYLAPEYFMYGKVSNKIDVYAYGVVLLELLTGRKPICDENPKGQESLVMWATPILERGDFRDFFDPNLEGKYDENQLRRMVLVASLCISRMAHLRPQMSQVLRLLQGEEEIESWINSKANNSHNELDYQDEEFYLSPSIGSHLGLALLDVEDDDASIISFEQNHLSSLDDYLKERWSRSSSFD
ncbi:uncharacterized protein A4U43_C04F21270 [Asparagus officinalis]|uniref:Protein kinase domain-containing protein n=1 Tax=Asparagus officinalis TaxID=4686 RepID=A0A5P1F5C3_ASPOF|nr:uncharacterized protein A4U43_C04F21270 [Asparagus officinalis]